MASKENYIQNIRNARTHQLKWVNQIKLMVSGVSSEKDAVPVNQSDSDFSRWLYDDAMVFSTSNAKSVIDEMIELHTNCYDIYLKIYATLFAGKSGGLMGVFGSKKASASDLKLAQNYYEELLPASDSLLKRLRAFESVMLATPQTKFDELIVAPTPEAPAAPKPETTGTKQKLYFRGQLIEG
ncbi:hypothetical protein WCX72_07735 [Sulfurimonas sp. HSL1-6]|uniref:hypothetical protein n=1 Tax=Thiomicrolovo immobilis TaxID=3131935 RepID=UPI0031F81CF7